MTTPTPQMLAAIQSCTLLDDVFREDPTTADLEAHCAALSWQSGWPLSSIRHYGEPNCAALSSHTASPRGSVRLPLPYRQVRSWRVALAPPPRLTWECLLTHLPLSVASLTGAMVKTVVPRNGVNLTLEDVKANAYTDDDIHTCPTRVISLENTLKRHDHAVGRGSENREFRPGARHQDALRRRPVVGGSSGRSRQPS